MTIQIYKPFRMLLVNATSYAVLALDLEGYIVFLWVERWDKIARMRFTGKMTPFFHAYEWMASLLSLVNRMS